MATERPELPSFLFSCEELLETSNNEFEAQQRSAKGSLQVKNHAFEQYWGLKQKQNVIYYILLLCILTHRHKVYIVYYKLLIFQFFYVGYRREDQKESSGSKRQQILRYFEYNARIYQQLFN